MAEQENIRPSLENPEANGRSSCCFFAWLCCLKKQRRNEEERREVQSCEADETLKKVRFSDLQREEETNASSKDSTVRRRTEIEDTNCNLTMGLRYEYPLTNYRIIHY